MKTNNALLLASIVSALGLTACHIGNSSRSSANNSTPVSTATLSGTAARGQAVANAAVTAKCVGGAGFNTAVTTNAQGQWSGQVDSSALPCALEVSTATGQTLHSYASKAGTVNITPFTDLTIAMATHAMPATWYQSNQTITATVLDQAKQALGTLLTSANLSLPANTDVFSSQFTVGDIIDKVLDSFAAAIQANAATVADYNALVIQASAGTLTQLPKATTPTSTETCASNNMTSISLSTLTDFDGAYMDQGATTFSLKVASASAIVNTTQVATITEACGPMTANNGTSYLLITDHGKVNLFKTTAGVISAEGLQFADPTKSFYGQKTSSTTPPTGTTKDLILDPTQCDSSNQHCMATAVPDFSYTGNGCTFSASHGLLTLTQGSTTIQATLNAESFDGNFSGNGILSIRAADGNQIDSSVQVTTKNNQLLSVKGITYVNFNPTLNVQCIFSS